MRHLYLLAPLALTGCSSNHDQIVKDVCNHAPVQGCAD